MAAWVGTFTIALIRNWNRIQKQEQVIQTLATKERVNDIKREIEYLDIKVNVIDGDVDTLVREHDLKQRQSQQQEDERPLVTHT